MEEKHPYSKGDSTMEDNKQ